MDGATKQPMTVDEKIAQLQEAIEIHEWVYRTLRWELWAITGVGVIGMIVFFFVKDYVPIIALSAVLAWLHYFMPKKFNHMRDLSRKFEEEQTKLLTLQVNKRLAE